MNIIHGVTDCSARDVGYDESRLNAVNEFFTRMIERKIIHGACYRLARHGKTFAAAALGSRHYKKNSELMQPDSVFGIASQTKLYTAVSIQILVEDGLLSIEDKVAKYLPQFDGPPYDQITIFHLLTHSSGLYSEDGTPDMHHANCWQHIEAEYKKKGKKADWIAAGLRGGLRRPPGTEWQYCNFGFQLLGAVIEKASGMHAHEFIQTRICKLLGMSETCFTSEATPELAQRAVIFDKWCKHWTSRVEQGKKVSDGMWTLIPGTAGSMISTTADVIRFGNMLANKGRLNVDSRDARVLGRKAVESFTSQNLFNTPDYCWGANSPERRYALGPDMRYITGALPSSAAFFHEGSGASMMIVDPREGLVGTWIIPWVGNWDDDCSRRIVNVVFSGIM